MSDPVTISLITMIGSLLAAAISLANNFLGQKNSKHLSETKAKIETLEVNTNSKLDELLALTSKEAFARGLKQGEDSKSEGKQ